MPQKRSKEIWGHHTQFKIEISKVSPEFRRAMDEISQMAVVGATEAGTLHEMAKT
jgi:hypothetical protein